MYSTVIFDLDGTLLNTLEDLHASVNFALKEFSFPQRTIEEIRHFIGNGVVKLVERSTPEGTDSEINKKCLEVFRKHYLQHMKDRTAPYEGVIELLEKLKKQNIRTAIVSNKLHSAVEGLCEDYFCGLIDLALGVNEEKERKPAPLNVIRAMEILGSSTENTIYVGDSEVDVQTAKNSSLCCIGVTWGFRDEEELRRAGAEYIAHRPEEIEEIIK